MKILTNLFTSTKDTSSEFSRFFRTASSTEKRKVFTEVARKAVEDQRAVLGR
jgi:hypothetical protein